MQSLQRGVRSKVRESYAFKIAMDILYNLYERKTEPPRSIWVTRTTNSSVIKIINLNYNALLTINLGFYR